MRKGRRGEGEGTIVEVVFVEEAAGNVAYATGYMNERTYRQRPYTKHKKRP